MANLTNSAKLIEEMNKKAYSNSLCAVATSGKYCDLTGQPTIPTVNNSTITIQKNGTAVGCFTTNASSGKSINITMSASDVGLGNVDNTSDANKPVSTATQTALNLKANAADVYTSAQTDTAISNAIDTALSSVYKYKGSKANYDSLPTTGNKTGDVWNVEAAHTTAPIFEAGTNVAWTGSAWDPLAGLVDLSSYAKTADVLTKTNTTAFTPTGNYQPATKKYVDDALSGAGTGDVTGPSSSTSGHLAVFDGTTGKVIKDGGAVPTVNNGTLTITQNGTSKGTFTANQSSAATIALTDTTYESKSAASGGTAVSLVTTGEKYTWNNKQNALTTQTAYTSKGTATKVPQITTNTLGQVTGITEVTITQPTVNNGTLTVTQNGTSKGTFTANQSGNSTIALTDTTYSNTSSSDIKTGTATTQSTVTAAILAGALARLSSDSTNTTSSGLKIWTGTQSDYDAITTKDATTLYFTTED